MHRDAGCTRRVPRGSRSNGTVHNDPLYVFVCVVSCTSATSFPPMLHDFRTIPTWIVRMPQTTLPPCRTLSCTYDVLNPATRQHARSARPGTCAEHTEGRRPAMSLAHPGTILVVDDDRGHAIL